MRRILLLLGISCLAAACYLAALWAVRPPIQLLVAPDATDIRATVTGWGEWTVTYRPPGSSCGWYANVIRQLEAKGWARSGECYIGGPLHEPATFTRITSSGFLALWEQVELNGDQRIARIRLRRWIAIEPLGQLLTTP